MYPYAYTVMDDDGDVCMYVCMYVRRYYVGTYAYASVCIHL